jgi:beta-glucosidase
MDKNLEAPYKEGIFVGYRYLEKNNLKPTFPFGFGLSYTTFDYSNLAVEKMDSGTYNVTLKVKNTGKVDGCEIVQLYVADNHSRVPRPVKELKGFAKVHLAPGEEKQVTMHLDHRSFAYWDGDWKKWTVAPGDFELLAGSSSADIRLKANLSIK